MMALDTGKVLLGQLRLIRVTSLIMLVQVYIAEGHTCVCVCRWVGGRIREVHRNGTVHSVS